MTGFRPYIALPYDGALDFNCRWISSQMSSAGIPVPAFFTGYLVIQSRYELDVVAVYSVAANNTRRSSACTPSGCRCAECSKAGAAVGAAPAPRRHGWASVT